jgi:Flp pilus assembly protein TadD
MKSELKSILFAIALAACGADRASSITYSEPQPASPPVPVKVEQPKAEAPKPLEVKSVEKPAEKPAPTTFQTALAEGRELAAKGEHARAHDLFVAAIKLDRKRAEPHVELARLYIATGDKGAAVVEATKATKLAPISSLAWNTLGRAQLARYDYDGAVEAFTQAVELNRDNAWAWNNLGFTELQLKKYDDAVEHLKEATERKGATGYMWNNLGIALEQLDRLDDARVAFDKGAELGSSEASSSRKRLDGVKTIAVAKKTIAKPEAKSDKAYDANEGETDEDVKMEGSGSGSQEKPNGTM